MQLDLGLNLGIQNTTSSTSAVWTPAQLPSLTAWYDAADTGTITLNGSTVSQWNDKSGNNWHMSQATATWQPTYQATSFNGKPSLFFDSSDDVFGRTITGFNATGNLFFAAAHSYVSAALWSMVTGHRSSLNSSSSGSLVLQRRENVLQIGTHNTDAVDQGVFVDVASLTVPRISTLGRSGGTLGNGGAITVSSFPATIPVSNGTQTWTSSSTEFVQIGGRQQAATAFANGLISEVIMSSQKPSDADRQKIEGYLAHKWNLTSNLPVDHPFKNTPPRV